MEHGSYGILSVSKINWTIHRACWWGYLCSNCLASCRNGVDWLPKPCLKTQVKEMGYLLRNEIKVGIFRIFTKKMVKVENTNMFALYALLTITS